ncbi:Uncharacterised protein [Mycobacteroides abscessus subsp. massiliense]|nr:Uncharacterised protein [Mycobacteroides abscessus subsp. massiliense]
MSTDVQPGGQTHQLGDVALHHIGAYEGATAAAGLTLQDTGPAQRHQRTAHRRARHREALGHLALGTQP